MDKKSLQTLEFDKILAQLANFTQNEPVKSRILSLIPAETLEEADEFLCDCMAAVVNNADEVWEYFEEIGADVEGMSREELLEASEVFELPDGRYLIVEA